MKARERVLRSLEHKEPDRVAIDIGATPSSGISAIAYNNLRKYLKIKKGHTRIYDVVQELAQPEDFMLDRLNIDVIDIGRTFNRLDNKWYEIQLTDGSTAEYPIWFKPEQQDDGSLHVYAEDGTLIAKKASGATFFDQEFFPYLDGYPKDYDNLPSAMNKVLWSALVHSPWDNVDDPDFWQKLRQRTLDLREKTDYALMVVVGCNLFEWGTFLRRIDNFLMDLVLEPKKVEKLLDALMEQHLAMLEKVCDAVGDIVDIVRFGDDLGTDEGPFMNPEIYKKLFMPRHKKLTSYIKENSDMYTFLHSCGSIYKFIPDLIEAGFDIINPVQTNARDMNPEKLKQEFGKDIVFWGGGADTRTVLNNAAPVEVKNHVKRRLEIFAPDGGFVFNTVHNILPDVPPENIMAMFAAIDEFYE